MMYPVSYLFTVPSAAYITMIVSNLFVGLTATLATFVLETFTTDEELYHLNKVLKAVFLIFPNYCLGRGIMDVARNEYQTQFDDLMAAVGGDDTTSGFRSPLQWDIAGRNVFFMAVQTVFWLLVIVLIEYRGMLRGLMVWRRHRTGEQESAELATLKDGSGNAAAAASVAAEKARVSSRSCDDNLRVVELRKSYQSADVSRCVGGEHESGVGVLVLE